MSSVDLLSGSLVPVGPVHDPASSVHGANRGARPKGAVFPVLHTPYDLYERF